MVDEDVYDGLQKVVGRRKIGAFLQDVACPLVIGKQLKSGYEAMAADQSREAEALKWVEGTLSDEDMHRVGQAVRTQLDL